MRSQINGRSERRNVNSSMDGPDTDVDVDNDDDAGQTAGENQLVSSGDRQSLAIAAGGGSSAPGRGKRTLIGFAQRSILEEFYRSGMSSASMQFQNMHQAACEKTGLDINVVKNWIRNRRRPTNPNEVHASLHREQIPLTPPHSMALLGPPLSLARVPPEAKRIRLDPITMPSLAVQVPSTQVSPSPPAVGSGGGGGGVGSSQILVKLRVAESGECDFVEVEVEHLSYQGLLKACCEELEVQPGEIVKIRKLPNVWVRKDRDVQRMRDGQELEVVLSSHSQPLTSVLTVNPFPSSNGMSLMAVGCEAGMGSKQELEHGNGVPISMADMCHPSNTQQHSH